MVTTETQALPAATGAGPAHKRALLAWGLLPLLFLLTQLVAKSAEAIANRWGGRLTTLDPDHAFGWMSLHHLAQLALTLILLIVWRRTAIRRWGLTLGDWRTSLRWFGWFALFSTVGVLLFGVGPHVLRGTTPQFEFPLNARNIAGRLGFYYLLTGTGEEPLFRGFVMGVLLLFWRREFRVGKLVMPAAGMWATLIFMLAHVGFSWWPPGIKSFSLPQEFFCLALGLYYALALYRTGSLLCPILAHGFFNGIVFTLLYALALLVAPPARTLPKDFIVGKAGDGQLDAALERVRALNGLPGMAAVSVQGDRIIELAAVGVRAQGHSERVTTEDAWHLGSITKPMTATLAAKLVEQGKISWETTVGRVFPELAARMRPEYRDVTLKEFLNHSAGLPREIADEEVNRIERMASLSPVELRHKRVSAITAAPPVGPRGKFLYSNVGYILAAAMLEEETDTPWERLMREEVFGPLGMNHAGIGDPGPAESVTQPRGHIRENGWRGSWLPVLPGWNAEFEKFWTPCGRVHMTLADMARFSSAHLAGWRGRAGVVSVESFRTLHTAIGDSGTALDWGVSTQKWAWGATLTHNGSNGRWYAMLALAPERNVAIFAASNAGGDDGARGVAQALDVLARRLDAGEQPRVAVSPEVFVPGQKITIAYRAGLGPLAGSARILLHCGHDGWRDVSDIEMSALKADEWQVLLDAPAGARELKFCFTDGSKWDNHSGLDWRATAR